MLAEAASAYVAKKILDYVTGEALKATGSSSAARVRGLLRRDPAELACQVALARVEARFATAFPQWHAALFDAVFLENRAALLLARALTRSEEATAQELAQEWAAELGGRTGELRRRDIEPAAVEFLAWWREELARHDVFRQVLDSRSLDSLAKSGDQTVAEVRRLGEELTAALGAVDRAVARARYPALAEFLDWPSRAKLRSPELVVGREWVAPAVQALVDRSRCGYVHVVADAGLGKTALAVALAAAFDAPAFFFSASAGRTSAEDCLNHLSVELIDRFELPHERLRDHAGKDSGVLSLLLQEAAERQKSIWLVIDALDEAEAPQSRQGNPLNLPAELPPKVFMVLTHRPGDFDLHVRPGIGQETLRITGDDPRQTDDIVAYLRYRSTQDDVTAALEHMQPRIGTEEFVRRLLTASEGNFMYLAYLLADITSRDEATLNLEDLPQGLGGYYSQMWRVIREDAGDEADHWEQFHLPVVERLAIAGEPVSADWLADHVGRDAREVRRVLSRWQRVLQRTTSPTGWRIIHQSFRDFLVDKDEVDVAGAHRAVAGYYLADPDRWTSHDGYPNRHLCNHLRHAGDGDVLFALVGQSAWRETQLAREPSGSGLLTDVEAAWQVATDIDGRSVAEGFPPQRLGRELDYALWTGELRSFSATLPTPLLVALTSTRAWTVDQVLAAIHQHPSPYQQVEGLTGIADLLPDEQRTRILREALEITGTLENPASQGSTLAALVPKLPQQLIADAVECARQIDGANGRSTAVAALALRLSHEEAAPLVAGALSMACCAKSRDRATALAALGPHLSADLQREALLTSREVGFASVRSQVVVGLAPHLADDVVSLALETAKGCHEMDERVRAVAALAAYKPGPQVLDAFNYEFNKAPAVLRARVIARFADSFPDHQRKRALAGALEVARMAQAAQRGEALALLSPLLRDDERARSIRDAFNTLSDAPGEIHVDTLVHLAPNLPQELLPEALQLALAITYEKGRIRALTALAPHLGGRQQTIALRGATAAAATAVEPFHRARAVGALVPHLPAEERTHAMSSVIEGARRATDAGDRVQAFAALAPHLPAELLAEALEQAADTNRPYVRAAALADIACHLPESLHEAALAVATQADTFADARAKSLGALAPHLTPRLVERALTLVSALEEPTERCLAIAALAAHLPVETRTRVVTEAVAATTTISHLSSRSQLIAALAPYMSDDELGDAAQDVIRAAIAAVTAEDAHLMFSWTLAPVARFLPQDVVHAAFDVATRIPNVLGARDQAFEALSPYLPDELHAPAIAAAATVTEWESRANVLAALAPHLQAAAFADALDAAAGIGDEYHRAQALVALARQVPDELAPAAFEAAATITEPDGRTLVTAALSAHVPHSSRAGVLAAATQIRDPMVRAQALVSLTPQLSEGQRSEALDAALSMSDTAYPDADMRAQALAGLVPHLAGEEQVRALHATIIATATLFTSARELVVNELAEYLARLSPSIAYRMWSDAMRRGAAQGQDRVADLIVLLMPLVRIFSSPPA